MNGCLWVSGDYAAATLAASSCIRLGASASDLRYFFALTLRDHSGRVSRRTPTLKLRRAHTATCFPTVVCASILCNGTSQAPVTLTNRLDKCGDRPPRLSAAKQLKASRGTSLIMDVRQRAAVCTAHVDKQGLGRAVRQMMDCMHVAHIRGLAEP
jgi:hypothetical protein